MLRRRWSRWSRLVVCALLSTTALASHNPADYPLRVHIFLHNSHSHYVRQILESVDGEGRANLYENGEPRGFDYSYRCSERISNSAGFETYPARWKKRDQTLEILLPKMGKPGAADACELKVEMKDFAYYRRNGNVETEPQTAFKEWMQKHEYDPEHGKNEPVRVAQEPAPTGANAPQ
jgi:hypothetical protein